MKQFLIGGAVLLLVPGLFVELLDLFFEILFALAPLLSGLITIVLIVGVIGALLNLAG